MPSFKYVIELSEQDKTNLTHLFLVLFTLLLFLFC